MLATTIEELNIPPLWYPAVQHIQAAAGPPNQSTLDNFGKGFNYIPGAASTVSILQMKPLSIEQLGWNSVEALETHLRFRNFAEDWDAPGMEAYDDL